MRINIISRQLIILFLIVVANAHPSKRTTIKVYHYFEDTGTQELRNSIVMNFNEVGLMIDSVIYSHTKPLGKKYIYVLGDDEGLKLKHTFKKEVILSYFFEYDSRNKKVSTTLIEGNEKVLWKEFLKYDNNGNLVKRLKYNPSEANNPEMMTSSQNSYKMAWAEIYDYDSTGTILEKKELYNNYILSVTTYTIDSLKITKKKNEYFDPSVIFQTTYFHNTKKQINHEISVDRFGKSLGSKMFDYDFMGRQIRKKVYDESGLIRETLTTVYDDESLKIYHYFSDSSYDKVLLKEIILNDLNDIYIKIKLDGHNKVLQKEVYYYDKKNRISKIKIYDMERKGKNNNGEIPIMLHTYEYD